MSELHDEGERPQQWRVACEECGKSESEYLRMHSQLKVGHLTKAGMDPGREGTYVQCNSCGNIRRVNE